MSTNCIHIPKPDIFSFSECLHFLDRGYDDCLYTINGNRIHKLLKVDGNLLLIQVKEDAGSLVIKILTGNPSQDQLEKASIYVFEWFDLERNLQSFYQLLEHHPRIGFLQDQYYGLRLMGIPDLFEAMCWCVIGQQINLSFAHKLKRRLVETYGSSIAYRSKYYYLFPETDVLAGLTVDELRKLQFSRRKAEYIIGIATEVARGGITKEHLANLSDSGQMIKELMNIRGVGEWTANYVLMKSLGRPDCITFGDSGLNSAVISLLGLEEKPTREIIETFFKPFTGWESYLVIYLWRTLS